MEYRIEKDTMGEIKVPNERYWGAQTERSLENFRIGTEKMPKELIRAFALLKRSLAVVNQKLNKLDTKKANAIIQACDEILAGKFDGEFPLAIWQTGSGTQTNMNLNEVIANRATEILGGDFRKEKLIHPNDHVNMSQSSNDTFPTAMHIASVIEIEEQLLPSLEKLKEALELKEKEFAGIIKIGRTHLQDATPLTLGQEFSGYRSMLEHSASHILQALESLRELAIGGTAVGTGINAHPKLSEFVSEELSKLTGKAFISASNKFHALTSHDALVFASGANKGLAANLMKIANDIRWLASGPRCGIGELSIPENEPGSSIMPGKVNPVIPEVVNQVCFQVIGTDVAVTMACEGGQLQLNVFEPVIAYNLFNSVNMMRNAFETLAYTCVDGITANPERCKSLVLNSIGLVTALNPFIGYENSTSVAKEALETGGSVYDIVLERGLLAKAELDDIIKPENMIKPRTYDKK